MSEEDEVLAPNTGDIFHLGVGGGTTRVDRIGDMFNADGDVCIHVYSHQPDKFGLIEEQLRNVRYSDYILELKRLSARRVASGIFEMRDPRKNPNHGDVLQARDGERRQAWEPETEQAVWVQRFRIPTTGETGFTLMRCTVDEWREWAADTRLHKRVGY